MEREWWGLPGPALFSSRVAADLREGKNVVVYMPTYSPPGFLDSVRDSLDAYSEPIRPVIPIDSAR